MEIDKIDAIVEERVTLISKKYTSKLSRNEEERLIILTEKMRTLFPRTTQEDFIKLKSFELELDKLREEDNELRNKYNLD